MKALKNEVINELLELEKMAGQGQDVSASEIYKLSKTLCYLHRACEIMHKAEGAEEMEATHIPKIF
jgi:hypothetical protein